MLTTNLYKKPRLEELSCSSPSETAGTTDKASNDRATEKILSLLTQQELSTISQISRDWNQSVSLYIGGSLNEKDKEIAEVSRKIRFLEWVFGKSISPEASLQPPKDHDLVKFLLSSTRALACELTKTDERKQEVFNCLNYGVTNEKRSLRHRLQEIGYRLNRFTAADAQKTIAERWEELRKQSENILDLASRIVPQNQKQSQEFRQCFQSSMEWLHAFVLFLNKMDPGYRGAAIVDAAGSGQLHLLKLLLYPGNISNAFIVEAKISASKSSHDDIESFLVSEFPFEMTMKPTAESAAALFPDPEEKPVEVHVNSVPFPSSAESLSVDFITDAFNRDTMNVLSSYLTCDDAVSLSAASRLWRQKWDAFHENSLKKQSHSEPLKTLNALTNCSNQPFPQEAMQELSEAVVARRIFAVLGHIFQQISKTCNYEKTAEFSSVINKVLAPEQEALHKLTQVTPVTIDVTAMFEERWNRLKERSCNVLNDIKHRTPANAFHVGLQVLIPFLQELEKGYNEMAIRAALSCSNISLFKLLLTFGPPLTKKTRGTILHSAIAAHTDRNTIHHILNSGPIEEGRLLTPSHINDRYWQHMNLRSVSDRSQAVCSAARWGCHLGMLKDYLGIIDVLLSQVQLLDSDENMMAAMQRAIEARDVNLVNLLFEKGCYSGQDYEQIKQYAQIKDRHDMLCYIEEGYRKKLASVKENRFAQ